jgi:hypothetical protein
LTIRSSEPEARILLELEPVLKNQAPEPRMVIEIIPNKINEKRRICLKVNNFLSRNCSNTAILSIHLRNFSIRAT